MKTLLPCIIAFAILFTCLTSFGQNTAENNWNRSAYVSDSLVNLNSPIIAEELSPKEENSPKSSHAGALSHKEGNSSKSSHMLSKRKIPSTLSSSRLVTGKTYNRYGDLANPKGFGIQVVTFKRIRNLCKYLHLYHTKEMYIQVITLEGKSRKMYRVILGASEDRSSVEHEIELFHRAGLQAVLRKHR